MSKIIAACPHCDKQYRVDEKVVGRITNCKGCQQKFEIAVKMDSDDSFGIPNANEYEQPFDPLAPARERDDDPAQTFDTGREEAQPVSSKARDWKNEIKNKKRTAAFGSLQKIALGLGAVLVLAGIVMNFLPLVGVKLTEGNVGRLIGLAIGLAGAGLVAVSLRKFKPASTLAGTASAMFVFLVFGASIIGGDKDPENLLADDDEASVAQDESALAVFGGPWVERYPTWTGFENLESMPSIADVWNRVAIGNSEVSASFLGKTSRDNRRLRVARTNVDFTVLRSEIEGYTFELSRFRFPSPSGKTPKRILNETEQSFGEEIKKAKSIEHLGVLGRDYRIATSGVSTHGRYFFVDDHIVHATLKGSSLLVPGALSHEFLNSLIFEIKDKPTDKPLQFELDDDQKTLVKSMGENIRQIELLMDEYIHKRCRLNFAAHYLTVSVGKPSNARNFIAHPGKQPIVGVDVLTTKARRGPVLVKLAPIYDAEKPTNDASVMAREGYALAAVNVNSRGWIKGVQLVFMRVTDLGFDTQDSYVSDWYGTKSSNFKKLGGDGKPVYGFWTSGSKHISSLGLIRENK